MKYNRFLSTTAALSIALGSLHPVPIMAQTDGAAADPCVETRGRPCPALPLVDPQPLADAPAVEVPAPEAVTEPATETPVVPRITAEPAAPETARTPTAEAPAQDAVVAPTAEAPVRDAVAPAAEAPAPERPAQRPDKPAVETVGTPVTKPPAAAPQRCRRPARRIPRPPRHRRNPALCPRPKPPLHLWQIGLPSRWRTLLCDPSPRPRPRPPQKQFRF